MLSVVLGTPYFAGGAVLLNSAFLVHSEARQKQDKGNTPCIWEYYGELYSLFKLSFIIGPRTRCLF